MPRNPPRVLIAIADPWLRAELRRAVAPSGISVRASGDAYGAWAAFLDEPEAFEMVVADFGLPGLSGPSLVRRLRGVRPALRALLLADELSDRLRDALAAESIAAARIPAPLAHLALRIEIASRPAPALRAEPLQAVG